MAISFLQKIRLAFRGWSRRREERDQQFLEQNLGWERGRPARPPEAGAGRPRSAAIDLEGLQCAYLDDSGVIAYYLDTQSGEVVEVRDGAALAPPRYRLVPTRTEASEAADRQAFVATQEDAGALAATVDDAAAFRQAIAKDRATERAWYNFKNERATAAIERWLKSGVSS